MTTTTINRVVRLLLLCGGGLLLVIFSTMLLFTAIAFFGGALAGKPIWAVLILVLMCGGMAGLGWVMVRTRIEDLPESPAGWRAFGIRAAWQLLGWYIVFIGVSTVFAIPFAAYRGEMEANAAVVSPFIGGAIAWGGYWLVRRHRKGAT